MATKQHHRGVILAAAGVCNGLVGALYMWSIFSLPLSEAYGWSPQDIAFAYSLYLIVECFVGFAVGSLQRSVSPRFLVLVGGTFMALGWFAAGCVDSLSLFYASFSVLGGIGSGFLYNTAVSTAIKWYPDKRGFANGICIGCTGLAPLLFAPTGNWLIESFDVSFSFRICGAIFLVCTLAFFWFLQAPPVASTVTNVQGSNGRYKVIVFGESNDCTSREMLRQPTFYGLWLLYAIAASAGMMMMGHASGIGQQLANLTASEAALQVGILAVANFAGRLFFGALSDRIGRFRVLVFVLLVTAIDLLFFFGNAHSFASFTVALCVVGVCYGGVMTTVPALCGDLFGLVNFGQNYAFVFSGYTCASLIGPMLGATVLTVTGTYDFAFVAAGLLSLLGIAFTGLTYFLARKDGRV